MLQGRTFREEEVTGAAPAVIISSSLARKVFPGERAVGRAVHLYRDPLDFPPPIVVGVCGDVPNNGLSESPDPEYYVPRKKITDPNLGRDAALVGRSLHLYDGEAFVIVRGIARADIMANWIRTEAAALDRTVPVTIATMHERLRAVSERPRFTAALLSLFAFAGVALAAGGLYGLISFLVIQRTREMGVRLAIGATQGQIVRGGPLAAVLAISSARRKLRTLRHGILVHDCDGCSSRTRAFASGGKNRSDDGAAA